MALTADDLKFALELEVNTSALEHVREIGKEIGASWEFQNKVIAGVSDELAKQKARINEIKMALDPELLKERARLYVEEQEALQKQKDMLEHFKDLYREQNTTVESAMKKVEEIPEALSAEKEILKQINRELSDQEERLMKIKMMRDPKVIKEQVAIERELAKEQAKFEKEKRYEARGGAMGIIGRMALPNFLLPEHMKRRPEDRKSPSFFGGIMGSTKGGFGGFAGGGGAAGLVMGGVGMAVAGVKHLAEAVGGLAAAPVKLLSAGLDMVTAALKSLTSELGPVGVGLDLLGGGLKMMGGILGHIPIIGDLLGPFVDALAVIPGQIKELTTMLLHMAGTMAAAPVKLLNTGLGLVNKSLRDLQGELGPIGMGFELVAESLQMVSKVIGALPLIGPALGPLASALAVLPNQFKELVSTLTSMARLASPSVFKMWTFALEDTQGVIGRTFIPILQMMTDAVRTFADVLATVLPSMNEVAYAVAPLREAWEELRKTLRDIFGELGPILRSGIVGVIRSLATILATAVKWFSDFLKRLTSFNAEIRQSIAALGLGVGMRGSGGAAARPVQIQGLEEYSKSLMASAFSMPGQAADSKEVQALKDVKVEVGKVVTAITGALLKELRVVADWVVQWWEDNWPTMEEWLVKTGTELWEKYWPDIENWLWTNVGDPVVKQLVILSKEIEGYILDAVLEITGKEGEEKHKRIQARENDPIDKLGRWLGLLPPLPKPPTAEEMDISGRGLLPPGMKGLAPVGANSGLQLPPGFGLPPGQHPPKVNVNVNVPPNGPPDKIGLGAAVNR